MYSVYESKRKHSSSGRTQNVRSHGFRLLLLYSGQRWRPPRSPSVSTSHQQHRLLASVLSSHRILCRKKTEPMATYSQHSAGRQMTLQRRPLRSPERGLPPHLECPSRSNEERKRCLIEEAALPFDLNQRSVCVCVGGGLGLPPPRTTA